MIKLIKNTGKLPGLRGMSHNGRVVFFTEPFWAVSYNMILVYATLYMQARGLTERQIGLVQTVLVITQISASLFSGIITDRFGRKRTTLFFDMLSWGGACLVWAFSDSVLLFLLAAVLNGSNKVVFVSFSCLMTEDADSRQRLRNYSGLHFMVLCCGIFAPLAGLLVSHSGLVKGMQRLYLLGGLVMALMFVIRHFAWNEPDEHPERSRGGALSGFRDALLYILRSRKGRIVFCLQGINQFFLIFKPLFYFVFLKNEAGVKEALLSLVPVISSLISMFILLLVLPRITAAGRNRSLATGFIVNGLSLFMLVISVRFGSLLLWSSIVLDAMGLAMIRPLLDSLWADHLEDGKRARQLSAGHFFFGLFSVPAGALAAELYTLTPVLPFLAAGALMLLAFLLCRRLISLSAETPAAPWPLTSRE